MRFIRGVCSSSRKDHVRNTFVYDESTIEKPLVKKSRCCRVGLVCHVKAVCDGAVYGMSMKEILEAMNHPIDALSARLKPLLHEVLENLQFTVRKYNVQSFYLKRNI